MIILLGSILDVNGRGRVTGISYFNREYTLLSTSSLSGVMELKSFSGSYVAIPRLQIGAIYLSSVTETQLTLAVWTRPTRRHICHENLSRAANAIRSNSLPSDLWATLKFHEQFINPWSTVNS